MSLADAPPKSLSDPALKAALQDLRRTDNLTNWWYVLRTYLYLAAVIVVIVYALGGVDMKNAPELLGSGAAGIAAVSALIRT